jgi:hypothetical protein
MDLIYCAGGNPRLTRIAFEAGWMLGMRSDKTTIDLPQAFIDIEYKRPDFERHLDVVARYRPKYATVPDLSDETTSLADMERALAQAERLKRYCEIPLIVPKLSAQLDIIPSSYAIGYSIPSSYGGAKYLPWELAGRRIHLLGGSPRKQVQAYLHLSPIATVMSADGNYAQAQAVKYAMYWKAHRWHYHEKKDLKEKDLYLECWARSCMNLMSYWRTIAA